MILILRWTAFLLETIGTLFIWLETMRFNARMPHEGFTLGDPPGYHAWYWHCGFLGFSLLLTGILITGILLLLTRH